MVLVPQHQIELARNNNVGRQTLRESVQSDLDEKMRAILADTQDSDYGKAKRYSAVLQRFLALTRQEERDASTTVPLTTAPDPVREDPAQASSDSIVTEILKNIAKNSRTKARYILEKMAETPGIASWNKEGEVILNNRRMPGTHLFDLIKNVTSTQILTEKRKPKGWSEYLEALSKLNIPLSLITNTAARTVVEDFKSVQHGIEPPSRSKAGKRRTRKSKVWDEKEWIAF